MNVLPPLVLILLNVRIILMVTSVCVNMDTQEYIVKQVNTTTTTTTTATTNSSSSSSSDGGGGGGSSRCCSFCC